MTVDGSFRRYRARRDRLRGLQSLLLAESTKWVPADDLPERELAATRAVPMVSRWLGVPVTLEEGRFACTMEFGTVVRGSYEYVVAPSLIAFEWDFEDEAVPVPGGERRAYLRFDEVPGGRTRVEVHQLVDDEEQARFMEVAWTMVLGRFKDGVVDASRSRMRAPRPK